MTGHKAKGATMKHNDILDMQYVFATGMVYVMLTRVTFPANVMGKTTSDMLRATPVDPL